MDSKDIKHRFDYHPPLSQSRREGHEFVRACCLRLAEELNAALSEGREKSLAITNLELTMFWANAALARAVDPLADAN